MGLERDIERIDMARTLEGIRHVVREYSATSPVSTSALYSGRVGKASAHDIAVALAERDKVAIIDDTPSARFLANGQVDEAIRKSARRLFEVNGADPESARKLVNDFLYGDAKAPTNSLTSIQNCLWCEASRDFVQSLRGDVKVIAVNANPYRVLPSGPKATSSPNNALSGRPGWLSGTTPATCLKPFAVGMRQPIQAAARKWLLREGRTNAPPNATMQRCGKLA